MFCFVSVCVCFAFSFFFYIYLGHFCFEYSGQGLFVLCVCGLFLFWLFFVFLCVCVLFYFLFLWIRCIILWKKTSNKLNRSDIRIDDLRKWSVEVETWFGHWIWIWIILPHCFRQMYLFIYYLFQLKFPMIMHLKSCVSFNCHDWRFYDKKERKHIRLEVSG